MATKSSSSLSPNNLTSNTSLNDQLNQTEIGAMVAKNKAFASILALILLIAVFGYGYYATQKTSVDNDSADKVFNFMDTNFKSFVDGKMDTAAFLAAHQKELSGITSFSGLFPTNMMIIDQLIKKNELAPARDLLLTLNENAKDSYQIILIGLRLATIYEDLDRPQLAIEQLERLNGLKTGILEAKNYLDLGRLYKQLGNIEKAKINFNYVVNNLAQDEFASLAKLYLSEIK
jgi:tetratricopeptide (TPR) repeat protein